MQHLKLKISSLSCALVLFFTFNMMVMHAQESPPAESPPGNEYKGEVGLRFMPTVSSLKVSSSSGGTIKGEVTVGYGIGGLVAFNFTEHVGVQAEVIYNSLSQKFKEEDTEHTLRLKYLNIPLLLSLNTGRSKAVNFNAVVGPQMGFSMGSSLDTGQSGDTLYFVPVATVKKGDIGLAYGAGVDFGINPSHTVRLGIGYRGVMGLIDISDNSRSVTTEQYYLLDRTRIKTNSLYIGLSVLF